MRTHGATPRSRNCCSRLGNHCATIVPIIASSSDSVQLFAPADPEKDGNRAFVLSHRGADHDEYLYFEYRRPLANSYDRDMPQAGVYVWLVRLDDSNENLAEIPSLLGGGKKDRALFLLAPEQCIGDPSSSGSRGVVKPLEVGGNYRFRWLDGTDTGLLFTVSNDAPGLFGSRTVSWTPCTATATFP